MKQEPGIVKETDAEKAILVLEEKIYLHNSEKTKHTNGALFAYTIRDSNGEIIAGTGGWTWANACEITQLWVSEKWKGRGFGKKLLEAAEQEAIREDCDTVLVRTYTFQAPAFYAKNGYKMECVVKDFPKGYNYFILSKRNLTADKRGGERL